MLKILINILMLAIMGQDCIQTTDGVTSVSVSSPKGCDELANPENGIVVVIGIHATYSCVSGYNLFGNVNRVCSEQHGWNGTEPVCYKDCPEIQNNPQTILQINGHHYQSVATYICLVGHCRETGDLIRTCLANGTWSGSELVCGKDCIQTTNGLTSGQYNHTDCIQTTDGVTSGQDNHKDCPELRSNSNIFVTTNGTGYNSVATYTCPVMYSPTGGDVTRVCQGDGTWSGSEPFCKIDLVMWIIIGVEAAVFLVVITGLAYKVMANRRQQSKRHENQGGHHHNDNEFVNHKSRNPSYTNGNTHMPHFSLPTYTPDVSSGEYSVHMENIAEFENCASIKEIDDLYTHHPQATENREVACTRL